MNPRIFLSPRALFAFVCTSALVAGCTKSGTDDTEPAKPPLAAIELGRVTETEIEIKLSAQNADKMAYYVVEAVPETPAPDAATVFGHGETSQAFETPESFEILELTPGTDYIVYAAASKDDVYSEVVSVEAATKAVAKHELVTDVSVSGLSVSYNIDLPDGCVCYHTYVEKWYYDYALMVAMQTAGPEFDKVAFMYNLVFDIGVACETSGQVVWSAGEEHPTRRTVSLTPGKEYYVIAAALDNYSPTGETSLIPFGMPASGGVSQEDIDLSIYEMTFDSVTLYMACDETRVAFFFYDLFVKSQFDAFKAENGERGMMDYLFEYNKGQISGNTYTDKWTVDAGESYVLAVYGIDYNGCEIYKELQIDVPSRNPVIALDIIPYERELQGFHDYDAFLMTFEPLYFSNELNLDRIWCSMVPMERATVDAYMEMFGMSGMSLEQIEQLFSQQPELLLQMSYSFYVYPIYDDAEIESLTKKGYFERVFTDLNADTEYVFLAMAYDGETPVVRITSARTAAYPEPTAATDGYKAYLGNWTLTGKTTADWSTYETLNLRIEELTANRSFKVYGWSRTDVSQEFPFVMRYHPETGSVSVEGPQTVGKTTVDGKEMDVVFSGKISVAGYDALVYIDGYNGRLYTGSLSDDNLSMYGEIVNVSGRDKEFMAMNYMLRHDGEMYHIEGDENDLVYFRINRAAASPTVSSADISPLRLSANRIKPLTRSVLRAGIPAFSSVMTVVPSARISDGEPHRHAKLQGAAK